VKTTASQVARLIDRIYAAGESGEGWVECLETVSDTLEGTGAHLFHVCSDEALTLVAHGRSDPAALATYVAYYRNVDPRQKAMPANRLPVGQVLTGGAVLPHSQLRKTEYYADFARPAGLTRALFGVAGHGRRVHSAVSVNRADDHDEFDDDAVEFLGALLPHFGRALDVNAAWRTVQTNRSAALNALDGLPMAVLLVDGHCRVCLANRRASEILARRDGLSLIAGVLRCGDVDADRQLRGLCAQVAATRTVVPRHAGGLLCAARPSSSPDYQILVAPVVMSGLLSVPGRDVAAVLYVSDPADTLVTDEERLRNTYHLTPAESRVAVLLAGGVASREIGERLRYTKETTRWYVKQVLAKAHCGTRSEFVARVANSATFSVPGRPFGR
jgi:DNA-binding CsgD family transcriptional regulator